MNALEELLSHVRSKLFDPRGQGWRRFYDCSLLTLASSGLISALVPVHTLRIVLSIAVIAIGIIGVWWERASR